MKKSIIVCLINCIFVISSVTNNETSDEGTLDYDDNGEIVPLSTENSLSDISTALSNSELSTTTTTTMKTIEENDHEMNINRTLSIFSLQNIESRFNELITKLDSEQAVYLNETKNAPKNIQQKYKNVIKSHTESITTSIEDFNKNFENYKTIKNEIEGKMREIQDNYIREIFSIEMSWISKQTDFYKDIELLMKKKQLFTTLEKIYQLEIENAKKAANISVSVSNVTTIAQDINADNSTAEKIAKNTHQIRTLKSDIDEIERKVQNSSITLQKNHQVYLDQTSTAQLKMTEDLSQLLNSTKYDEVVKSFDNFLKTKKTIEKLLKLCTDYSSESNAVMTDFSSNLSNLSSQLVMSKIMPNEREIVNIYSKDSNIQLNQIPVHLDAENYKWVQTYQGNKKLSESAVIGGQDVDGVLLYVARIKDYNSYLYGKFAFSKSRRHAYFPYENVEYGVEKFEILTSPNYIWCDYDKNKNYNDLPICQAEHNFTIVPGMLEKKGVCRIGYDFKVYRYYQGNFKVLRIRGC